MQPTVFACVICAAILHASWNAVLRGGRDRLWSMTLMMVAIALASEAGLLVVTWPGAVSWPYLAASALIHVAYNLSLVHTYRTGDLGQSYPVSRGSSPVLIALGAWVFAQERPTLLSIAGIGFVSTGIVSLAFESGKVKTKNLRAALTTGVLIGAYTVVDGVGVRLSGSSLGYAAGMFLLWSLCWGPVALLLQRRPPIYSRGQTATALGGGLVSVVAYGIVIWAMQFGAMAAVSALRETSVV